MIQNSNLQNTTFDWGFASPNKRTDVSAEELRILVSKIIIQLGVPANIKGYTYLREAIIIKVNCQQTTLPLTKVLYPDIGKKFHISANQVERAIRRAIEVAWDRAHYGQNTLFKAFHFIWRPTNSELIAMIADHVTLLYM